MNNLEEILGKIKQLHVTKKTILIAIDGFGGSGKTTLANKIKDSFSDATIVQLDDFYSHELNRTDRARILEQVIKPLREERSARYQIYDWKNKKLTEWRDVKPGGIVIVEGVSMLHDDFNDYWDLRIWVNYLQDEGIKRGIERDKKEYGIDSTHEWVNIWMPQETEYVEMQKPQQKADYIIDGAKL
ncbi:MAG: uridine kinase [Candidatus Daviesbacteria bacterium]|nr:uridine kinase [Candidatus Daviesbacteria bacterium]